MAGVEDELFFTAVKLVDINFRLVAEYVKLTGDNDGGESMLKQLNKQTVNLFALSLDSSNLPEPPLKT